MILLWAVLAGLIAGLGRALLFKRTIHLPELRSLWLVPVAFLPQFVSFYLPATRVLVSDHIAAASLICSQVLLLLFIAKNTKHRNLWLLGIGLSLNFIVIILNGGLMPISPETVSELAGSVVTNSWETGQRLWQTKDIVLSRDVTVLPFLSDQFLLPSWMPTQVAFSVGDIFIAVGVFILFWASSEDPDSVQPKRKK